MTLSKDKMKSMGKFDNCIVSESVNIRSAIKQMDKGGIGFITIIDNNRQVSGVITDGDFRRAILRGVDLEQNVLSITNTEFKYLNKGYSNDDALKFLKGTKIINYLPVLDNGKLADIISIDSLHSQDGFLEVKQSKLNLPAVIMAGGKGTRLDPFTRILPKALVPIGEKPIIEVIMDEYAKCQIKKFYVSVNHRNKMIKAYFEDHGSDYNINYVNEDEPLGSAGALKLLESKFDTTFFVSNCDVIIKSDYSKIVEFHKKGKYDLTIVGSMQHYRIPYGVCSYDSGGLLTNFREKPEYDYLASTGMYVLNPQILSYIPEDKYFDMIELISILRDKSHRVGVYPVSEKSWIDVGQWQEYRDALKSLEMF